jgi:HNH endonuclease
MNAPAYLSCPYCAIRPRDSDDHIFPDFLGGTLTIRSCTYCNNTFGHTFESAVLSDLAPIMVVLRSAGLAAPRYAVWKKAKVHEGVEIDIDTDLKSNISQSTVEKDERGIFRSGTFQSEKAAKRSLRGLQQAGEKARIIEQAMSPLNISEVPIFLTIGVELRRLAMKIGVAAADRLGHHTEILDLRSRAFLIGEPIGGAPPVLLDMSSHEPLQKMRPPLSHNVFVKGNGRTGHCYAVVVFYGFIQVYAILNDTEYKGPDFAVFGFLSPVDYSSELKNVELISLPIPPQFVPRAFAEAGMQSWQHYFCEQAKAVFGAEKLTVKLEYVGTQLKK